MQQSLPFDTATFVEVDVGPSVGRPSVGPSFRPSLAWNSHELRPGLPKRRTREGGSSGAPASGALPSGALPSVRPSPSPAPQRGELVFVRHPKARRYVIRVRADGIIRVTIPRWGSKKEAKTFADSERAWIDRQLAKVAEAGLRPVEEIPPDAANEMRARARRELPARLLELAARYGLTVSRVSVRNQRWRWGSCSPGGHICLNWRLVAMPDWICDYVLIHELMHLKRMDHSPKFWKLVADACPNYREARAGLRARERAMAF
jgi:predicted metal-dependent hydrolase